MPIVNSTLFRKNLFNYLNAATVNDEKIIITTKNGNAVVVNEEYLRSLEETCYLSSIPGMKESIIEGKQTKNDDCVEIDWEDMLK